MHAPLLSIGLPVHNGDKFLAAALDTLLSQDFTNFELIISDNASSDQTEDICRAYAARDQRIRYIRNKVNIGAIPNHNRLVTLARGKYFKWAAHDDECHRTMLGACVEILESSPSSVVLVYTQAELIDETGAVKECYTTSIDARDPAPHRRLAKVVAFVQLGTPMYGVHRTEALLKTRLLGSFFSDDHVLLGELAMLGEIWEIAKPLFRKRVHAERATAVHSDSRAWDVWSNPGKRNWLSFLKPTDRVLLEHLQAVLRANLPITEKGRCFKAVLRNYPPLLERIERWKRRGQGLFGRLPSTNGQILSCGRDQRDSNGQ